MFVIIGYVFMCVCILGAYVWHGGHLAVFWQPSEIIIIFGGAIGGMVAGSSAKGLKLFGKALPTIFKGSPFNKVFYMDLFACLFELLAKVRKEGLMSIEGDVEVDKKLPQINSDLGLTALNF